MNNSNESKFYETDTEEKTVQNQHTNVVQIVGQGRKNKMRNEAEKYQLNIPTTRQGRLIKCFVRHYMDIILADLITKIVLKCMVYKVRIEMSEGSCTLNRIKKDEKEEELLAVAVGNIQRLENLKRENEKLSRGLFLLSHVIKKISMVLIFIYIPKEQKMNFKLNYY